MTLYKMVIRSHFKSSFIFAAVFFLAGSFVFGVDIGFASVDGVYNDEYAESADPTLAIEIQDCSNCNLRFTITIELSSGIGTASPSNNTSTDLMDDFNNIYWGQDLTSSDNGSIYFTNQNLIEIENNETQYVTLVVLDDVSLLNLTF